MKELKIKHSRVVGIGLPRYIPSVGNLTRKN